MKAVGCTGQMHNHLVWHRYVRALRKEGKTSHRKASGNQPTNQQGFFPWFLFSMFWWKKNQESQDKCLDEIFSLAVNSIEIFFFLRKTFWILLTAFIQSFSLFIIRRSCMWIFFFRSMLLCSCIACIILISFVYKNLIFLFLILFIFKLFINRSFFMCPTEHVSHYCSGCSFLLYRYT